MLNSVPYQSHFIICVKLSFVFLCMSIHSSDNFSVVTDHRLLFNHDFDWDNPNISHEEKNKKKKGDSGDILYKEI